MSGPQAPSPWRWTWYLPGLVAVVWGVQGLIGAARGPDVLPWLVFVAVLVVAHDALLAPVAVVVGWLSARFAGGGAFLRAPLQVGLAGSAVFVLAGLPLIVGRGVRPDEPSALPYDYAARVGVLCALWWAAMAGWALLRFLRRGAGRADAAASPSPQAG